MTVEFYRRIFEKYSNMKFHENPSSGGGVVPCGWTDGRTDGRTERRTDATKILAAFPNFPNGPKKHWQIPCITSRSTPSVVLWCKNWIVVCISDVSRYSVRPTNARQQDSTAVYECRPHAPFPDSYPAAAGCSAARLLARPTSGTQVVTRLCKSDIAKNVSFSCYITGRKVKGKVRPACTAACNWRPTAGVRSKQLRAAGWGLFGRRRRRRRRRRGGGQGPKFGFLLRFYFLRSVFIFRVFYYIHSSGDIIIIIIIIIIIFLWPL